MLVQNSRVQKFQQPQTIGSLNPTFAPDDTTVASSGGKMMTIVNLSLPGEFSFGVNQTEFTGNGMTTTVSSMVPQDPSAKNNKRQMDITIGKVTITT